MTRSACNAHAQKPDNGRCNKIAAVPPNAALSILSGFLAKMRLVLVTVTLATCLLGSGLCQLDCPFPTEDDVREVMANRIASGGTASNIVINLTRSEEPLHIVGISD